jgi:hypothetical protein
MGRRQHAIDLRFDEHVVGPANHHEMFDIVAADEHQLTLSIEAEGVDESKPRLARSATRNSQSVREHKAINERQRHKNRDPASHQNRDLEHAFVAAP